MAPVPWMPTSWLIPTGPLICSGSLDPDWLAILNHYKKKKKITIVVKGKKKTTMLGKWNI